MDLKSLTSSTAEGRAKFRVDPSTYLLWRDSSELKKRFRIPAVIPDFRSTQLWATVPYTSFSYLAICEERGWGQKVFQQLVNDSAIPSVSMDPNIHSTCKRQKPDFATVSTNKPQF